MLISEEREFLRFNRIWKEKIYEATSSYDANGNSTTKKTRTIFRIFRIN